MDQQPPYQPTSQPLPPQTPHKTGLAIASLVLGIIGLVTGFLGIGILLGIIAAIFGIVSLVTHRGGKGMAIAGISTGSVAAVFGVFFFMITIVAYGGVQNRAETVRNESTAKTIMLRAEAYNAIEGTLRVNHYPSYDELLADKVPEAALNAESKDMLHEGTAESVSKTNPVAYESCLEGATIYYYDVGAESVLSLTAGNPEKC